MKLKFNRHYIRIRFNKKLDKFRETQVLINKAFNKSSCIPIRAKPLFDRELWEYTYIKSGEKATKAEILLAVKGCREYLNGYGATMVYGNRIDGHFDFFSRIMNWDLIRPLSIRQSQCAILTLDYIKDKKYVEAWHEFRNCIDDYGTGTVCEYKKEISENEYSLYNCILAAFEIGLETACES